MVPGFGLPHYTVTPSRPIGYTTAIMPNIRILQFRQTDCYFSTQAKSFTIRFGVTAVFAPGYAVFSHGTSMIFPGFNIHLASNAFFTDAMTARVSGPTSQSRLSF